MNYSPGKNFKINQSIAFGKTELTNETHGLYILLTTIFSKNDKLKCTAISQRRSFNSFPLFYSFFSFVGFFIISLKLHHYTFSENELHATQFFEKDVTVFTYVITCQYFPQETYLLLIFLRLQTLVLFFLYFLAFTSFNFFPIRILMPELYYVNI